MINSKEERLKIYMSNVDWDMDKYPDLLHMACVNWLGSGKDLLLNSDIFSMYFKGHSIFDDVIKYIMNRPNYKSSVNSVHSNAKLNPDLYGDDYYKINDVSDIADARDSCIYINDAERYFNSKGLSLEKANPDMINLINNTRKDGNFLRFSCHRFMNIHTRVRQLILGWIFPDMYWIGGNCGKMNSYVVYYKMLSHNGKQLCQNILPNLPVYAGLYDTLEKAEPFSKSDL